MFGQGYGYGYEPANGPQSMYGYGQQYQQPYGKQQNWSQQYGQPQQYDQSQYRQQFYPSQNENLVQARVKTSNRSAVSANKKNIRQEYKRQETYSSQMEQAVIQSNGPVLTNETQTIQVNGVNGIWLNKAENMSWRGGAMPLDQYKINSDMNYKRIIKPGGRVQQVQEVQIKYLNPPQAPAGDIIVQQENDISEPAAPPLIIRQQASQQKTPERLIIREEPPIVTQPIPPVTIVVPGRRVPPPPRKVIIERLPSAPAAPQHVVIERWLTPKEQARRVRFIPGQKLADQQAPRNILIEYEDPQVELRQKFKFLGIQNENPDDYRSRYGSTLVRSLPRIAKSSEVARFASQGQQFASNSRYSGLPKLYGDVDALRLVKDLERYGLGEYRSQIENGRLSDFASLRSSSPPVRLIETARYTRRSPYPSPTPISLQPQTSEAARDMYVRSSPSPTLTDKNKSVLSPAELYQRVSRTPSPSRTSFDQNPSAAASKMVKSLYDQSSS